MTVAERLHLKLAELTPAERKVARALLAEYPVRGLQPVAKLAATAGVSAPTVIRLVSKLSFDSYAEFQRSLKSEVSARLSSPLTIHAGRSAADHGDVLSRSEQVFCDGIRSSFARLAALGVRPGGQAAGRAAAKRDSDRRPVQLDAGRVPRGEPAGAAR